jgi:hypothetical protein
MELAERAVLGGEQSLGGDLAHRRLEASGGCVRGSESERIGAWIDPDHGCW